MRNSFVSRSDFQTVFKICQQDLISQKHLYIENYISVIFHITISIGLLIFNAGLLAAVDVRGPLRQRRGVRQLRHAQVPRRGRPLSTARLHLGKPLKNFRQNFAKIQQNSGKIANICKIKKCKPSANVSKEKIENGAKECIV